MNWRALGIFFKYFFLFSVNKKRQLIKKMACGKFEETLQFLYFDLKRIKHFLLFCKDNLPQPWCEQRETHSPSWCEGECSPKKWVLSILKEIIKNIPDEAKIGFFLNKLL